MEFVNLTGANSLNSLQPKVIFVIQNGNNTK